MKRNFTLLEMSVVLLIIVAISSFVISNGVGVVQRTTARTVELRIKDVKAAIDGGRKVRDYDGYLLRNGYLNDMGSLPQSLDDLVLVDHDNDTDTPPIPPHPVYTSHPLEIQGVNVGFMGAGWNGPYLSSDKFSQRLKNMIEFEPSFSSGEVTEVLISSPHIPSNEDLEDKREIDLFVDNLSINLNDFKKTRIIDISFKDKNGAPLSISRPDLQENVKTLTLYYWYIKDGEVVNSNTGNPLDQDPNAPGIQLDDVEKQIPALPKGLMAFYVEYEDSTDPSAKRVFQLPGNKAYKTYRQDISLELIELDQPVPID